MSKEITNTITESTVAVAATQRGKLRQWAASEKKFIAVWALIALAALILNAGYAMGHYEGENGKIGQTEEVNAQRTAVTPEMVNSCETSADETDPLAWVSLLKREADHHEWMCSYESGKTLVMSHFFNLVP